MNFDVTNQSDSEIYDDTVESLGNDDDIEVLSDKVSEDIISPLDSSSVMNSSFETSSGESECVPSKKISYDGTRQPVQDRYNPKVMVIEFEIFSQSGLNSFHATPL